MTERGEHALRRAANELAIGPSALHWDGDVLTVRIDERTVPFAGRLRGTVRVRPVAFTRQTFTLDQAGLHRWSPLAPCAQVDVTLEYPKLNWSGAGYLDCNEGDAPLEDSFANWHWSRAAVGSDTVVLYDIVPRVGDATCLALRIDAKGDIALFEPPPPVLLRCSRWGIARATRAHADGARVRKTLEDTPFYTRSVLDTHLFGQHVTAMHESLSLQRFRTLWVQAMLPFRMPRVRR
jgi:carotenoid 1,2-hydratase